MIIGGEKRERSHCFFERERGIRLARREVVREKRVWQIEGWQKVVTVWPFEEQKERKSTKGGAVFFLFREERVSRAWY